MKKVEQINSIERLEKRHSITSKNILYEFQLFDRNSFKTDGLSEVIEQEYLRPEVDLVVIYTGIQGESKADTDDKGRFYGLKP